jgi:hypothetical protein
MSLHPDHVAWTGGTPPRAFYEVAGSPEGFYVVELFNNQCMVWMTHWKEKSVPLEQRNIFWGRARYDAHATYRNYERPAA